MNMQSSSETVARIIEQGNGFPDVGDCVHGNDGNLYRVLVLCPGIYTDDCRGNYVRANVREIEWEDCPEGEEFCALCVIEGD